MNKKYDPESHQLRPTCPQQWETSRMPYVQAVLFIPTHVRSFYMVFCLYGIKNWPFYGTNPTNYFTW